VSCNIRFLLIDLENISTFIMDMANRTVESIAFHSVRSLIADKVKNNILLSFLYI